jgi:hypothetical protein
VVWSYRTNEGEAYEQAYDKTEKLAEKSISEMNKAKEVRGRS